MKKAFLLLILSVGPLCCMDELNSALHQAVKHKASPDFVSTLNDFSVPLDAPNKKGDTALHIAVRTRKYTLASRLIKLGASKTIRNNKGKTPLSLAFALNDGGRMIQLFQD